MQQFCAVWQQFFEKQIFQMEQCFSTAGFGLAGG
jgi:hypothetical protein